MEEYKKAEQVKIKDTIYSVYNGKIVEIQVASIKFEKDCIYLFNENYMFGEKSSKGITRKHNNNFLSDIKYEIEESSKIIKNKTLHFTDIRCARTFAIGYFLLRIKEKTKQLSEIQAEIEEHAIEISKLR